MQCLMQDQLVDILLWNIQLVHLYTCSLVGK